MTIAIKTCSQLYSNQFGKEYLKAAFTLIRLWQSENGDDAHMRWLWGNKSNSSLFNRSRYVRFCFHQKWVCSFAKLISKTTRRGRWRTRHLPPVVSWALTETTSAATLSKRSRIMVAGLLSAPLLRSQINPAGEDARYGRQTWTPTRLSI